MDASPVLETPIHLPWPSRIARRLRQAMSVPHETWRGGREEARKETLERRESDAFEVVLGSVSAYTLEYLSAHGAETRGV